MMATRVDNAIVITSSQTRDGICVLETPCNTFSDYKSLPTIVHISAFGKSIFALTGWNSDRGVAYYRDDTFIAYGQ